MFPNQEVVNGTAFNRLFPRHRWQAKAVGVQPGKSGGFSEAD